VFAPRETVKVSERGGVSETFPSTTWHPGYPRRCDTTTPRRRSRSRIR
jgi:hypothetical protein